MKIEQYVMAYEVEQDKIRAILPEDFSSLRPVFRIIAEVADDAEGYIEFNVAVEKDGKKGWLNVAFWKNFPFERMSDGVRFKNDFLDVSFNPVGIRGGCPAEKDNDGCFFVSDGEFLRKTEVISAEKEFCDCIFEWKFSTNDARGKSLGKTLAVQSLPIKTVYPKRNFTPQNAASIPCEKVLGCYLVVFER